MVRADLPQTDLFGAPSTEATPRKPRRPAVAAVAPADADVALAAALPRELHLGTSTWSFAGWQGLVYDGAHEESKLAREGLAAYARHPLLRAVGVDRSFYAPVGVTTLERWRAAVPESFRFLMKAHAALTTPRTAHRPEFLRGAPEAFLDVDYATQTVIDPARRVLGERLGVVLFQFSPLGERVLRHRELLLERLGTFLRALPRDVHYAVEWRDAAMLGPDYQQMLAAAGAVHGLCAHPRMPALDAQGAEPEAQGPLVIRWLLAPGRQYEEAKAAYAPFDRLVDPDFVNRSRIVSLGQQAVGRGRTVIVIVNNKAEGSAPLSVAQLARQWCAK
jgi:uncharacterized protein YecE (DUF72 family)